jgi:hypothetical protein
VKNIRYLPNHEKQGVQSEKVPGDEREFSLGVEAVSQQPGAELSQTGTHRMPSEL